MCKFLNPSNLKISFPGDHARPCLERGGPPPQRRFSHACSIWSQQALPAMTQVNTPQRQPAASAATPAVTSAHLRSAQKSPWLVSTRVGTQEKEGNEWEEKEASRGEDGGSGRGEPTPTVPSAQLGPGRQPARGTKGSSAHGILQARMLERVATPFSRGSSPPRNTNPCFPGASDLKEATSKSDMIT